MAPEQRVAWPSFRVMLLCFVGLEQDADVQVLDGGALELLEVVGSGVCTPTEARVDAVDCGGLELAFQEGNALVQPLPDQRVIRELDCSVVPGDVVSPVVLTVNH